MHFHASWLLMSLTNALKRIFRKGIMNKLKIRIETSHKYTYTQRHTHTHLEKGFIQKSLPWQGHSSVQHMFCSLHMLVLCAHFFPKLESNEQMWFLTETITSAKDNRRYIPVYELGRSLSPTACQILPVAHALTGCDTTFSLFRIGKKNR